MAHFADMRTGPGIGQVSADRTDQLATSPQAAQVRRARNAVGVTFLASGFAFASWAARIRRCGPGWT